MFKRLLTAAACLGAVASAAGTTTSSNSTATTTTTVAKPGAAKEHVQLAIRRGDVLSRAANLGGWLLSEYWMSYTSPLYKGISAEIGYKGEYGVMKYAKENGIDGQKQFEEHWATWLTEKDIAEIAKAGLNTVRVSTGYWIINDEDDTDQSDVVKMYPRGGLKYLDALINDWAVKHNLAVMVSLHAHKGSQNGMDHSAPVNNGKTAWSDDAENARSSLQYATFIANRYKDSVAFLGLNLMNEPTMPTSYEVLFKYYKDAYTAIRADGNDCIIVTSPWLQEQGPPTMMDFMPCPEYYNVWHEFHVYYKWGWEQAPLQFAFDEAATYGKTHYDDWTGNPVYLGEWSLASGYEETITEAQLKAFGEIQMKEAEKSPAGWAFWAWRHDDETKRTSGWSMRQLIKKGLLTIPTTAAKQKPRNAKCPPAKDRVYSNANTTAATGASGSGSGSGVGPSVSLFTPEKVKAGDAQNVTAPAAAPTAAPTAASGAQVLGSAVLAVAASSLVAALSTL